MSTSRRAIARVTSVAAGALLATVALGGTAYAGSPSGRGAHHGAATSGPLTAPQPLSTADRGGRGANPGTPEGCGAYCSTRDGSASGNGKGGAGTGKPCAGCVGRADNKNPPGQHEDGSDRDNGYECDGNSGIGRTNPAHTGCSRTVTPLVTPPVTPPLTPPGKPPVTRPVVGPVAGPPAPVPIGGATDRRPATGVLPTYGEPTVVTNGRVSPVTLPAGGLAATGGSTELLLVLAGGLLTAGVVLQLGSRRVTT